MPLRQLSLFDEMPLQPAAGTPPAPAPAPPPADLPASRAQRDIRFGEHRVVYALRRARRRSIGFVIGADGLTVSAPRWVGMADIEAALHAKAGWILRKLHEQRERARRLDAARVDWCDGVCIPFLGRSIAVRLDPQARAGAQFDADSGTLRIGLPHGAAPAQMRDTVQSWLQREARRIFEDRCATFAPRLGVRIARLGLSSATTRWGSASASGAVRLNWRLVHFALPVIDYVVAHELAHLREMNHSAAFWSVVRSVVPDYEEARGTLHTEVLPVFG